MKKELIKSSRPLAIVFVIVAALLISFKPRLAQKNVDADVVLVANLVLLVFTWLNLYFQSRNINNPNPNAVIRGVMAGMFLKLFGLAAAVLIYLLAAGQNRSVNAVFFSMGLYIVYTWIEVRISLQMKPKK